MSKPCVICGKAINESDSRKQYCSNACKQESYRQRHGIDKPAFLTASVNKPSKAIKETTPVESKPLVLVDRVEEDNRFVAVSQAVVELNSKIYRLQFQKDALLSKIAPLESPRSALNDVNDGIQQAAEISQLWRESFESDTAAKIGAALGLLGGFQRLQNTDHDEINRKNRRKARLLRGELRVIDEQLNDLTAKRIYLENGLNQLKREIKTELTTMSVQSAVMEVNQESNTVQLINNTVPIIRRESTRVISLSELKAQEFDVYEFSKGFEEIIGNPSKNFSMVVYGESGQGKSTWVIEFAHYLAEQHGRILYNSSEERISQSLKRKLLKFDSDNFAISECQTYKALKQAIRGNGFKFVVIDSINDMNIKPNQLSELTEMNPDKAFIYIMQATKQGNYKGNSQFVHDVDILIKLENYMPIVEKTRYK